MKRLPTIPDFVDVPTRVPASWEAQFDGSFTDYLLDTLCGIDGQGRRASFSLDDGTRAIVRTTTRHWRYAVETVTHDHVIRPILHTGLYEREGTRVPLDIPVLSEEEKLAMPPRFAAALFAFTVSETVQILKSLNQVEPSLPFFASYGVETIVWGDK